MKLDTQMTIASNLRTLRTSKRLSQAEVAGYADISRSLYTHYELGSRTQDAEVLYIISTQFGIDMTLLFEKDQQKFLSHLASNKNCDAELMELLSLYKQLSPFSKGMLMERALALIDREHSEEENQKTLQSIQEHNL